MSRNILRALAATLPVLGLTTQASDGMAVGIDRFAWPLAGSSSTGPGFDHDRTECPKVDRDDGLGKKCDPAVEASTYLRDRACGTTGTYEQHTGNDTYADSEDLTVHAAAAGVVVWSVDEYGRGKLGSTDGGGFGNHVILYHGNGLASLYGHMLQGSGLPAIGQWVECDEAIGQQGSSGNSSNDHLHFDVRTGITVSSDRGGYYTGTYADPFASSKDADEMWCGASSSLWVDHSGALPSRTCDEDPYVPGQGCHSGSLDIDVSDGECVQDDACAWSRCIDGAWLRVGDGAPQVCETENHVNDACEPFDCGSVADQAICAAWAGTCGWSCDEEACVTAAEADGQECTTEPPATCDNGELDGEETGIDCGGPDCAGCSGDPCLGPEDCASGSCGDDGTCEPAAFDCHGFDGDPASCGNATGCVYHECAASCSPNTETACAAGCEEQCGTTGCVTATTSYYSSNNCISGPAGGIAELYRFVGDTPVLDGMVGLGADGRFCADLQVGEMYYLQQSDLPGFDCFPDYYVGCTLYLTVGEPGVDGVCAEPSSCEDLGALEFDCGS